MTAPAFTIAGLKAVCAEGSARPCEVVARLRGAQNADDPAWILRCAGSKASSVSRAHCAAQDISRCDGWRAWLQ